MKQDELEDAVFWRPLLAQLEWAREALRGALAGPAAARAVRRGLRNKGEEERGAA